MLFGMILEARDDLFRLLIFAFHLVSVALLPHPFENDFVVGAESLFDDEEVVQLILNFDLALMRHVVLIDDVNVSLLKDLEGCPLRNHDGAMLHSAEQEGPGLTVTQQSFWVRKIGAEWNVSVRIVEVRLNCADLAKMSKLVLVGQH